MVRVIVMPTGRRVPLRAYLRAYRTARTNPDHLFMSTADVAVLGWPMTGREFRRMFVRGVHDRINRRGESRPTT